MWEAIGEIAGDKQKKKIIRAVGRKLSANYEAQITATDPRRRLEQFARILEAEGGLVELCDKGGRVTVIKRTCPFTAWRMRNGTPATWTTS